MSRQAKEKTTLPEESHGFYTEVGQEIIVHFIDGKAIKGTLNLIGRYEIFMTIFTKDGKEKEISVFKGAIKYII